MRFRKTFGFLVAILLIVSRSATAAIDYWKVKDIKAGMKGYALTVFKGDEPERFDVEILGTQLFGDEQKIIFRASGGPEKIFDKAGICIVAGMSGSPVFVEEKLVGAIAFSWNFAKEPIGGITPFEYMKEEADGLPKIGATHRSMGRSSAYGQSSLQPIPLIAGDSSAFDELMLRGNTEKFQGMIRTNSSDANTTSSSSEQKKLEKGSAMSVAIIVGDYTFNASGTVTAVDGDRIYAFGHSFLGEGPTKYPAWRSSVVTIFPSLYSSFKIGGAGAGEAATITYDGAFGAYGVRGKMPELTPVELTINARGTVRKVNCGVVGGKHFPEFVKMLSSEVLSEFLELQNEASLEFLGRITPKGLPEVFVRDYYVHDFYKKDSLAASFVGEAKYFQMLSGVAEYQLGTEFDRLALEFTIKQSQQSFTLERAFLSAPTVRPDSSITLSVVLSENRSASSQRSYFTTTIEIPIPKDILPQGKVLFYVEDGMRFVDRRTSFTSRNIEGLIAKMNAGNAPNNRLYVQVVFPSDNQSEESPAMNSETLKAQAVDASPGERKEARLTWKKIDGPEGVSKHKETSFILEIPMPTSSAVVRGEKQLECKITKDAPPTKKKKGFWKPIFG